MTNSLSEMTTAELYQRFLDGWAEWQFDNSGGSDGIGGSDRWGVPEESEWGSDCRTRGTLDLPAMGPARAFADVCSSGGEGPNLDCDDPDLAAVIRAAWCMLQDNADLVGPVCELVFGLDGSCIVKEWGLGERATPIVCTDASREGWWFFNNANPCPFIAMTASGRVAFCVTRDLVEEYARVFRDGTDDERLCVTVDMAATIFHEFTHVCALNLGDLDSERACRTSDLAENTFKWLLLRRYPGALNALCCATYVSSDDRHLPTAGLFMSDTSTHMDQGRCAL